MKRLLSEGKITLFTIQNFKVYFKLFVIRQVTGSKRKLLGELLVKKTTNSDDLNEFAGNTGNVKFDNYTDINSLEVLRKIKAEAKSLVCQVESARTHQTFYNDDHDYSECIQASNINIRCMPYNTHEENSKTILLF